MAAVTLIRNRPVTSFLILAFAISYAAGIPFNFATSGLFPPTSIWALYVPRLVTVFGPAIAALVVTRSRVDLVRSLLIPLRYWPWVAMSVIAGIATAIAAFRLAGAPGPKPSLLLGAHFVFQIVTAGIGEELGWRGWMLPTLARERTFASATALTGLAWIVWHAPVFMSSLTVALSFLALLAALSVVFAWLWIRTNGNTGVVAIAHAAVNAPFVFLESSARGRAGEALGYLAAFYVCLAVVPLIKARRPYPPGVAHP